MYFVRYLSGDLYELPSQRRDAHLALSLDRTRLGDSGDILYDMYGYFVTAFV